MSGLAPERRWFLLVASLLISAVAGCSSSSSGGSGDGGTVGVGDDAGGGGDAGSGGDAGTGGDAGSGGDAASGSGASDADFKAACDNGVTLCKSDPQYGQTFGAQDCSDIAASYAGCDSTCRVKAQPIVDCQKAATTCAAFASCVM